MVEAVRAPAVAALPAEPILACRRLSVRAGKRWLLRGIDLEVPTHAALGILGPSGVGKSTLLKCLNRLVDLEPRLLVEGDVELHGRSVYGPGADPDRLRRKVGILFQQPAVFPSSILGNVLFGVRHMGRLRRPEADSIAERALTRVHLWEEVRDRLSRPAAELSVGQQQRLCLARTLALEPEVVLMDEPTSALDPAATAAIEELIHDLTARCSVVLVTHDPAQAARVCGSVVRLAMRDGAGELESPFDEARRTRESQP